MTKPSSEKLAKGTVINRRYEIIRFVGEGGQKRVYEAKDLDLQINQRIVLKEMKRSESQEMDLAAMQLFEQESIITMKLSHHCLPKLYDFFIDQGTFYIIQEYVEGEELDLFLIKRSLSEAQALEFALQLANFLNYLHTRKSPIIFRDLKPANIIVGADSKLFIVDMSGALLPGIGKMAEKVKVKTAGYYPPDAPDDIPSPDKDIYALGVVLYEMITRHNVGKSGGKPPPVGELRDNVSPEIEILLNKTVFFNREFRIGTAWEAELEIEEALRSHKKYLKMTGGKEGLLSALYSSSHKFYVRYVKTLGSMILLFLIAGIPAIPHITKFFFPERGQVSYFPPYINYFFCAFALLVYLMWVRTLRKIKFLEPMVKLFHTRIRLLGGYRPVTIIVSISFVIILLLYSLMVVEIVSQFL